MSIKDLLLRFTIIYAIPLIILRLIVSFFVIQTGSSFIIAVIFAGCVFWACLAFGEKNRRFFSMGEAVVTALCIAGIDFILLLLFAVVPALLSPYKAVMSVFVFESALIVVIHCFIIYFTALFAKKQLLKKRVISDVKDPDEEPDPLSKKIYDLGEKYANWLSKNKRRL